MAANYIRKLRLLNRDTRWFIGAVALIGFSYLGIDAVVLNLYLLRLGYGPQFIGAANAASALAFLAFCVPAGALGTRWGNRDLVAAGVGLGGGAFGLTILGELLPVSARTTWLLGTFVVAGLGRALNSVNQAPLLMTLAGREERDYAFSIASSSVPLAGFVGGLVGGALPGLLAAALSVPLTNPAPYRYPLLLSVLARLLAALSLSRTRKILIESEVPALQRGADLPLRTIIVMGLVGLLGYAAQAAVVPFFNVYMDDALGSSTALIGALVAAGRALAIPATLAAPLFMARLGKARTITWVALGQGVALLPLVLIPNSGAAGMSFIASSALFNIATVATMLYGQESVSPRWRAAVSSAAMLGAGASGAAIAYGGGYAITALGYRALFAIGAGLTAAMAVVIWMHSRGVRGEVSGPEALD